MVTIEAIDETPLKETSKNDHHDWHESTILTNHNHGRSALISTETKVVEHDKSLEEEQIKVNGKEEHTSTRSIVALVLIIIITIVTYPPSIVDEVSIHHVWYYGWITAVSTGLGVVPLIFVPDLDKFWVGVSNGKLIKLTN